MPNIRYTNDSTTGNIDIGYSKKYLCLAINLKSKVKGYLIMGGYANSSFSIIFNGLVVNISVALVRSDLVGVSHNYRKVTSVGFYHALSILNEASATNIYPLNDYVISHPNKTSLLQIADNSLLSTSQYHSFGIAAYDFSYHYIGKQYTHYGQQFILMKFDKALVDMPLIYVSIW